MFAQPVGCRRDRNPERPVHCQEGEACHSDPNQSVFFHLSQRAGRRASSVLDFGRTNKRASNSPYFAVHSTLPVLEILIAFDDANLGCEFAELGPRSNFRRDVDIIFDILGSSR